MSDDDRDIDIESDDEDEDSANATQFMTQAEKRAHHNALERKRRDHIKESFHNLRDSVPSVQGEKVKASRAQILKQATDYIQFMTKKSNTIQHDIDDLKKQNSMLESQIRALEKAKTTSSFATSQASSLGASSVTASSKLSLVNGSESESSDCEITGSRRKKLKVMDK